MFTLPLVSAIAVVALVVGTLIAHQAYRTAKSELRSIAAALVNDEGHAIMKRRLTLSKLAQIVQIILIFTIVVVNLISRSAATDPTTTAPTQTASATAVISTTTPNHGSTPSATAPPPTRKGTWSQFGFNRIGWSVTVSGPDSECVQNLKHNQFACKHPLTIVPQTDLIVTKDSEYFTTLLIGEEMTIEFDTGRFEFFAFYSSRPEFVTTWPSSAYLFVDSIPALLTKVENGEITIVNLQDGRTYLFDGGSEIFTDNVPGKDYPHFGYLLCTYTDTGRSCTLLP